MKEGYLQLKIAELNDKLNKIDQMFSLEKSKIELLEERVGGLKDLIKKLKDLDGFKENILKDLKNENEKMLSKEIKELSEKIPDEADKMIGDKTKKIDKFLEKYEEDIRKHAKLMDNMNSKINYLVKHNEYLMMKLVNKMILSDREVNELDRRSAKNK